jgi:hypothetical protein
MSEAETAFAEARKKIADAKATGATELNLSNDPALTRLPEEITDLAALRVLHLHNTQVAGLAPLTGLANLQTLTLSSTQVADIAPLAGLTALTKLTLSGSHIADLRPLINLDKLGTMGSPGLTFTDTSATAQDATLARLAEIEDARQRAEETRAYLATLPPWPEPLPWEVRAARDHAPPPDPALPLVLKDGQIDLRARPFSADDANDPLREALFADLQDRVADLMRISGNLDETIYREACRLHDRLEAGLSRMEPVRVHLIVEALRRLRGRQAATADQDLLSSLDAVLDIGPDLTLDSEEVATLLRRQRENRLDRRDEAETEAEIRIAQGIADSPFASSDLGALARAAADPTADDQLTGLRGPLVRNWTIIVATSAMTSAAQGVVGNASYDALHWVVAHGDDILAMARSWGGACPGMGHPDRRTRPRNGRGRSPRRTRMEISRILKFGLIAHATR